MNTRIGNLEEAVLLIALYVDEVYGVTVAQQYEKETGSRISVPAIHTVLRRLEEKGILKSFMGDSSPERGGRRKRLYEVTAYGLQVAKAMKRERISMWSKIPALKMSNGNG